MSREWVFPDQWDIVRTQATMDTANYNVVMSESYEHVLEYIEDSIAESYETRVIINNAEGPKKGWMPGEDAAKLFTQTVEEISEVLDDELYEVDRRNSRFKDNYSGRPELLVGRKTSEMKHTDLETSGNDYVRPNIGFQLFVSGNPKLAVYGKSEIEDEMIGEQVGAQGAKLRNALESYFGFRAEELPDGVFDPEPHSDVGLGTGPMNRGIDYSDWEEPEKSMFEIPSEEEKERKTVESKLTELV